MLHEPTTSITDFILGLETLILAALLAMNGHHFPSQPYWITTLALLGVAALLGGVAHGLAYHSLFTGIYLGLAIMMATFVLAALTDSFGPELVLKARWLVAVLALIFLIIAWFYPSRILTFAAVEAVVMFLALIVYIRLALVQAVPGAGYLSAGTAFTLAAAALLLKKVQLTLVWTFDGNGVYHLVQMVGVLFFYLGLSLRA
ncbi:MAG: hypothetical protein ACETWG_00935 [Candidatus Neomarinimicrobiota bacterium]